MHSGNLCGELCEFVVKFDGLYWKIIKLGTDPPHEDGSIRKSSKHQIEVDANICQLPLYWLYMF